MFNRQLTAINGGQIMDLYMAFIWRKSRLICISQIKAVPLRIKANILSFNTIIQQ